MRAGRNAAITAEGERKSEHKSTGNQALLVLLFSITNEFKPSAKCVRSKQSKCRVLKFLLGSAQKKQQELTRHLMFTGSEKF